MAIELVQIIFLYVNAFTLKSGGSEFHSPMTLVEGIQLVFNKHFHIIFGEYAQTFKGSNKKMKGRTIGAIALGLSGNSFTAELDFLFLKIGSVFD